MQCIGEGSADLIREMGGMKGREKSEQRGTLAVKGSLSV